MEIIFERQIPADKIVVSPRPVWKCRTCPNYQNSPSCPPYAPSWKDTRDWIRFFQTAIIVKFQIDMAGFETEKREVLGYLLKKEQIFFNEGHPFAFALFPGNCNLCEECEFKRGGTCKDPTKIRPSVDAVGIEIKSIVRIDFSESVLYGLILID